MKDKVLDSAVKLGKAIDESALMKEYLRLKTAIETDPYILDLAQRIKASAKLSQDKTEFLKLKNEYETNPLIVNFKQVEEQVKDLLGNVKDILEDF